MNLFGLQSLTSLQVNEPTVLQPVNKFQKCQSFFISCRVRDENVQLIKEHVNVNQQNSRDLTGEKNRV